ncbi:hypothetical protein J1N35_037439 [Gossypium stocksii]|uniref:Uncharacterized protein n=1 Tax=Gossypium stocksii TaxID=47602 RepID=A0A9D3ZLV4_9ROSI|nr:hypothetical protein J1N35_037439 [Gossypium stocksii]
MVLLISLLNSSQNERVCNCYDHMSQEKMAMMASNSHAEGGSGRVPTRSDLVVPASKFKGRRVSAARDFPPGCGRVAAPNFRSSKQIIVFG